MLSKLQFTTTDTRSVAPRPSSPRDSRSDGVKIVFTPHGREDYCSWGGDRRTLTRINRLITEAAHDPGSGTGKPERLSGDLAGCWSRRIDQEHRLVYTVHADEPVIVQARYHY